MYKFSLHAVAPFASCVITLLLAIFVFLKNRKSKLNLTLSAFAFLSSIWQFSTAMMFMAQTDSLAIFWDRCVYLAVAMMFPVGYHFAILLSETTNQKNWIRAGYLIAIIYLFISPTDYFISGLYRYKWGCHTIARVLHHPFVLISTFYYLKGIYLVFSKYKKTTLSIKRQQYKYYFLAFFIYVWGTLGYLPAYKIGIYPFAYWFATIYASIVAYAIIRYRLLEIDTVIHRTILWIITSIAVFLPIFGAIYFIRDFIHDMSRLNLSLLLTVFFFVVVYYYKMIQPQIDNAFSRRKYDYYRVLSEIGQKIGSELDIKQVANRLFKELREVLYIRSGILLVQGPGEQDYIEIGNIGYEQLSAGGKKVAIGYTSNIGQWISQQQRALEREQIEVDPQYAPIREETISWLDQNMIEVLIPVVMEDKVNGLVGIGKKENLQAYTLTDIELLEKMGRQIGVTIDNALHHEDIVEKERLAEELKLGREIQQNLLPKAVPVIEGLKLQGLMIPAKEIGGDYYDYISTIHQLGEQKHSRLGIVIGDVSGKGVAAGLIMATAKATLKGLSQQDLTPKQILSQANNIIFEYTNGQKFMTMLYFQYREKDKTLNYSSAGHEHILIYQDETQAVETIQSGGFMLGMIPNSETFLEEKQLKLASKDKILLYTDGVTEAENEAGDRFGLHRLKDAFQKHGTKPINELMQAVKEEIYSFIGPHPQYDDITLVVMETA